MDFYNNFKKSQNHIEKVIILREIQEYSTKSLQDPQKYKIEAGPLSTQDDALSILKPDEYIVSKNFSSSEPICSEDPGVWWIVVRTPTCFAWLKGNCKKDNCGFNHGKETLINVEKVNTTDLFRKMYNRNRKLKIGGIRKKNDNYINPFTGKEIPVRTPEFESVAKKVLLVAIQNKATLINTLKDSFKLRTMKTSGNWSLVKVCGKEITTSDVDNDGSKEKKNGSWADVVKNK